MTNDGELPAGVIKSDLEYPSYKSGDQLDGSLGDSGLLTFHKTNRFGWVLATLHISHARRSSVPDRTYAVTMDGRPCRVGNGPHVTKTIKVYIRKSRAAALKKYTDLFSQGVGDANDIRDRISSRRSEGQLRRSRGERSWMWDN